MATILIRYAEIGLKGANRSTFEEQLRLNVQRSLDLATEQAKQYKNQVIVTPPENQLDAALQTLQRVYGIAWFASVTPCENELDAILATSVELAKPLLDKNTTFRIKAQRSNKKLRFTSPNIEREAGHAVIEATQAPVDIHHPDVTIHVVAAWESAYVFTERIEGLGGLPVGSSGKVLALLSGGFDSILAAHYLARRGAQVDFLHFHIYPDKAPVLESKIQTIVEQLTLGTYSEKLFLASYLPFEMAILELHHKERPYELVLFRRLMAQIGEAIAKEHGYQALVFGDSLGQVASQTMENITAVDDAVSIPIFRPLIGFDKHEVINQVRQLGFYDLATAPYKDCCSLISPEPVTKAFMPMLERIEDKIGFGDVTKEVSSTVEEMQTQETTWDIEKVKKITR
ncbi:MAG: tRNA 4-thiouridine(8) synthase ThiI [Chloroflexi bacterium]|nr:MAG: tRNA 4-thiouridine(8) synthase ThiI [Chloroflexota bacterium]MBL1196501.1 tRNA 4-thiouridine(8) synthase ThiI [Chloroflexota bacterium]NOH13796.1 tRNA 4-thiouridine(8) synthase ThiI [Chloroflexota bacterium]